MVIQRALTTVAAFLLTLTLAAEPALAQKKTLVVALNQDPDILDPTPSRTYVGRIIFSQMCEKLYEIDELFIFHDIHFIDEYHNIRNADLTSQKNMFASLRHRTINCGNHQNSSVHLRSTGDHIFHVIRMTWTIHVSIVTVLSFIFHVRGSNGQNLSRITATLRFRCLRYLIVRNIF